MNEAFLLQFLSAERQLNVMSVDASMGVAFDTHPGASPLVLAFGLQPLLPGLLDLVQRRHDWRNKEFKVQAAAHNGLLRLSGADGDPNGLPAGVYDITVELESFEFSGAAPRIILHDGEERIISLVEKPGPLVHFQSENVDALTAEVIRKSFFDDRQPAQTWLMSRSPRPARQACLLNILAKLRLPPEPQQGFAEPLTSLMDFAFFADVDRSYFAVSDALPAALAHD